jgi:hypothetical protein
MAPRAVNVAWTLLMSTSFVITAAGQDGPAGARIGSEPVVRPWISHTVTEPVRLRLEAGFELAVERLRERRQCKELFVELGAHGVEALSSTLYYPADLAHERQLCRGAVAYTTVGGAATWVCRRVTRLPRNEVAMVLVHEALHRAGLGEWPHDRDGPRPREIDHRVRSACGL